MGTVQIYVGTRQVKNLRFQMAILAEWSKVLEIFLAIFIQDNVLYIWVEFKNDRMSSRESAKIGQIGAYGLNCKIFVNSELIFSWSNQYEPIC